MIKLVYMNNVTRDSKIVSEDEVVKDVLDSIGFDYSRGITSLNGSAMTPESLGKTFGELNTGDTAFVTNVAKAANA